MRCYCAVCPLVQCINGKHSGNTGMVVKSENGVCVVFSDMTQKEFRAFARDLTESQEIATGQDKIGDYDLHDLVVLDHQTVGVIVHVEKDSCRVLTNHVGSSFPIRVLAPPTHILIGC